MAESLEVSLLQVFSFFCLVENSRTFELFVTVFIHFFTLLLFIIIPRLSRLHSKIISLLLYSRGNSLDGVVYRYSLCVYMRCKVRQPEGRGAGVVEVQTYSCTNRFPSQIANKQKCLRSFYVILIRLILFTFRNLTYLLLLLLFCLFSFLFSFIQSKPSIINLVSISSCS